MAGLIKNLSSIKSEGEIADPCQRAIKKDTVYEVHDLNLISDLETYVIEFKLNGHAGLVYQRSPFEAIQICPDNIERIKFKEIITQLENIR